MSRSWTVTIPAPERWLNSNQRRDRRGDAPVVRAWREAAAVYARQAKLPKLGRAHITAILSFADRRHRDSPNYYPTIKAAVDGLVDAYVLDDDDDLHVVSLTIQRGPQVPSRKNAPQGVMQLVVREVAGG